jgi:hypothetical protein
MLTLIGLGFGYKRKPEAPADVSAPTVRRVSSALPDGTYEEGAVIPIRVTFTEPVLVTGTPKLTIALGEGDKELAYVGGSGSRSLYFNYTVAEGDTAADLDYAGTDALALDGGTIKDAADNEAVLTLAAPGSSTSLAGSKALVISAPAPEEP